MNNVDVNELINLLLPYTQPILDDSNPDKTSTLLYRTPTVETTHRQYVISGVRTNNEGDPVIMIDFIR